MPRLNTKPSAAQLAAREAGAARLRAAAEKRAKDKAKADAKIGRVPPTRTTRHDVETHDLQVGQDQARAMSSTGPARIESEIVEVIDRPLSKTKTENLAFDQEILTITVLDSTNPDDEPIPYVINGGRRQAFIRGKQQKVKRMFVEVLARMKRKTYKQRKERDSQDIDTIINVPHTGLVYPFAVNHDPNPKGAAWLEAILAEG